MKVKSYNEAKQISVGDVNDTDDESVNFNDDSSSKEPIVMSANLMSALGMDTSHIDTRTDWKPPARPGLQYSTRIVPEVSYKGHKGDDRSDDESFRNSRIYKSYENDAQPKSMTSNRSDAKSSKQTDSDGDSDNDDEDRVVQLSSNLEKTLGLKSRNDGLPTDWRPPKIHGLLNNVIKQSQDRIVNEHKAGTESTNRILPRQSSDNHDTATNDSQSEYDESEYDLSARDGQPIVMSANLMKALGMDTSHIDTTTDWKPPDRPGLQYSNRIIPNYVRKPSRDPFAHERKESSERILPRQSSDNHDTSTNDSQSEYDESEYDLSARDGQPIVMSANLMKALGMDTSHIDTTTDWKPPDRPGLQYSNRIIPTTHK